MKRFCIADGYVVNVNNSHHVDIHYTDEGQKEVYEFAQLIMGKYGLKSVADIGCGSGYKLMKYLSGYDKKGYEVEPALSFLKSTYPDGDWIDSNITKSLFSGETLQTDLVICADVIEHVVDPDVLLNYIKTFNSKFIIISTPCREVLCRSEKLERYYGSSFNGPPFNHCHVREWTFSEFREYLSQHFEILESHFGAEQIECQYHLLKLK